MELLKCFAFAIMDGMDQSLVCTRHRGCIMLKLSLSQCEKEVKIIYRTNNAFPVSQRSETMTTPTPKKK